ncbi:MAG: PAS domain-containing protein [Gemmatimonadetes bacterium]|nr:PAS domain-containing protein [Gemmatimonadota bacterium]
MKLAIAFAIVALGPLAVVSAIGARETVRQIEAKARAAAQHDLEMTETQTAQALNSAQNHIELIAQVVLGPILVDDRHSERALAEAEWVVQSLLATERSLYQVKLIDAAGRYRLIMRASGLAGTTPDAEGGEYYAWRARALKPGQQLVFAVEVAGPEQDGKERPVPAVAIVLPLSGSTGEFVGVVVGEAYASSLFSHMDNTSPGFGGVTGLVDADGRFLFHSIRKRDWTTLLAARDQVTVRSDFREADAKAIVSGRSGSLVTADEELVSFRPLSLGAAFGGKLFLYRVVPLAALTAPARAFLLSVLVAAALVTLLVLGLAIVAADQFTRPIFLIRDAAWQLARGDTVRPLNVTTNDEFEELARDFTAVADRVAAHRAQREEFIAERSRVLEQTHAELTDILEHSADGIVGLDAHRVVRIWNHGAERLFGYPSALAIGQPVDRVLRPASERAERERGELQRELMRDGAVVNFLTEVLARDESTIQISLTETLITASDGRPLGSSLIVRDNRFQSRLDDQMRRSERLAAISVMAAGLAHEINNPLAIIGNRIECIQRDLRDKPGSDATLAADIDVLQQHVSRLRELTSSLLRFARDDERADARPVALAALAEGTVALLRRTLATRRLRLDLVVDPGVPSVLGYDQAIETVIVNLLLNAADATPAGGTVTLALRRGDGGEAAEIEVRDTGPGIAPALRERVFEPFFTTKATGHGTGLGLTVCRSIVDGHGGSIRVECPGDGGCRFIVTLPVHPLGATWTAHAYS